MVTYIKGTGSPHAFYEVLNKIYIYISTCLSSIDCAMSHCTSYCLVMPICQWNDVSKCKTIAESSSDQLLASSIAAKSLRFGWILTFIAFNLWRFTLPGTESWERESSQRLLRILERHFIGLSAWPGSTIYSETQHNQHSTGKLLCKYILFRIFIESVWAPCVKSDHFVLIKTFTGIDFCSFFQVSEIIKLSVKRAKN